MYLVVEEVDTVVDPITSASVVGKRLACKLGIWTRPRKVKIRQGDGSFLGGNYVVNIDFKVIITSLALGKCVIDTEVFDIGNSDIIWGLSGLMENRFLMDTQNSCLRNVNSGQ